MFSLLKSLGYTDEQIEYILKNISIDSKCENIIIENFKNNFNFLRSLGFNDDEII